MWLHNTLVEKYDFRQWLRPQFLSKLRMWACMRGVSTSEIYLRSKLVHVKKKYDKKNSVSKTRQYAMYPWYARLEHIVAYDINTKRESDKRLKLWLQTLSCLGKPGVHHWNLSRPVWRQYTVAQTHMWLYQRSSRRMEEPKWRNASNAFVPAVSPRRSPLPVFSDVECLVLQNLVFLCAVILRDSCQTSPAVAAYTSFPILHYHLCSPYTDRLKTAMWNT